MNVFLSKVWKYRADIIMGAVSIAALILLLLPKSTSAPVITHPNPSTTNVVVSGSITPKVVTEFISDPKQQALISQLLAENKSLKLEVTTLTSTVARLETHGGVKETSGTITPVEVVQPSNDRPDGGTSPTAGNVAGADPSRTFNFKDFRLNALYSTDGKAFSYSLTQDFTIVTTVGRARDGSKTSLVKLFTTEASGKQVEVSSKTVALQEAEGSSHWFASPRIQGGAGVSGQGSKVGVVALQWLKHGSSTAAEDTTFAVLSPAWSTKGLVLLPVSWNTGRIKHNPFTNLWVSPTLGLDKSVGGVVTATF